MEEQEVKVRYQKDVKTLCSNISYAGHDLGWFYA